MPPWVKAFLIAGSAIMLVFALAKVTGVGGEHSPGRHGGGDGRFSSLVHEEGGHTPPVDHRR